jgi:hypothetical protein
MASEMVEMRSIPESLANVRRLTAKSFRPLRAVSSDSAAHTATADFRAFQTLANSVAWSCGRAFFIAHPLPA